MRRRPFGLSNRILFQEVESLLIQDEDTKHSSVVFSMKSTVKEIVTCDVLRIMERDLSDFGVCDTKYSQVDKQFISALSQSIHFENGHYEQPLSSMGNNPCLTYNRSYALNRVNSYI